MTALTHPSHSRITYRTLTLLALASLTHCAGSLRTLPPVPAQDTAQSAFEQATPHEPPGLAEDPAQEFVLAPGDVVRMRSIAGDNLAVDRVVVDATGGLTLPFVGPVQTAGLSMASAADRISLALRRYDRFATVYLEMLEPLGHRASVLGVVPSPGVHPVGPAMRVSELLALAGGATAQSTDGESVALGDLHAATLMRDGAAVPISVMRAMEGHPRHNVRVRAGDLLYVPPTSGRQITVLGQVRTPRVVSFRPGISLANVIALAGGTTRDADTSDLRIVRGPLSRALVYRSNLGEVFSGRAQNPALMPGDIVFVTEHWFASATQVLERLTPLMAMAALTAGIAR